MIKIKPISQDRQDAHKIMLSLGWEGSRTADGKRWVFTRPDGGECRISHNSFGTNWVSSVCVRHEPELRQEVMGLRNGFIRDRLDQLNGVAA